MASPAPVTRDACADPVDEALARSESSLRSPRMFDAADTDATLGAVRWKPVKSLWITAMTLTALIGGPLFFTWGAVAVFLATTANDVCLGHSLGMHRRLIHRSYDCPRGPSACSSTGYAAQMAGPLARFARRHRDGRKGSQNATPTPRTARPSCAMALADGDCELGLAAPAQLSWSGASPRTASIGFLDRTWMAQQPPGRFCSLPSAACPGSRGRCRPRGRFRHGPSARPPFRPQPGSAFLAHRGRGGAGRQRPRLRSTTMGEAWHNNHHAFPRPAKLGFAEARSTGAGGRRWPPLGPVSFGMSRHRQTCPTGPILVAMPVLDSALCSRVGGVERGGTARAVHDPLGLAVQASG